MSQNESSSFDHRPRLLLVEDVPDAAHVMSRLLGMAGYRVISAFSVQTAVQILENIPIEIAICDIVLPDGSAFEILPTLQTKGVPAIGMSGHPLRSENEAKARAGFLKFLVKPVPFEVLKEALEEGLRQSPKLNDL